MNDTARIGSATDSDRSPFILLLGLLIASSLAADFLMVIALVRVTDWPIVFFPLVLATLGSTLAQGCLLAAWLAWGCGPFWQRLAWHWGVATVLYLVWMAGLAVGEPDQFWPVGVMVGFAAPLMSIAAQLPLWIARQMFGWRLVRGEGNGEGNDGIGSAPLSIRDLMTATLVVASALALVRLAPSPDGEPMDLPWVILFGVAAVICTMTLLPTSPWLMRTPRFGRGVLLASLYAGFWIGVLWLVVLVGWNWGLFRPPPIAVVIGFSFFIFSFALTVMLAAAAARAHGYRLITGRLRRSHGEANADRVHTEDAFANPASHQQGALS